MPPPPFSQVTICSLRTDGPDVAYLVHANDMQTLLSVLEHTKSQRILMRPEPYEFDNRMSICDDYDFTENNDSQEGSADHASDCDGYGEWVARHG